MIISVLMAGVVVLVAVGGVGCGWWLPGRAGWSRRQARLDRDWRGLGERHRLDHRALARVRRAAYWGRALTDPAERAAAAEWAAREAGRRRAARTRGRRLVWLGVVLLYGAAMAGLVAAEVLGRLPGFPWWWAVSWACVLAVPLTETRWLDRAVRVNGDDRAPVGVR
ncbi:conserved membrane protein of unknown function [Modestobacter italicus]|uniref:Uncharacterized protein n=1 Tax=Modestobacter italicus (strain DSM 44449 / CECT 9708 / BC 501) TaxID=2732864 RepID=I4EX90_MODI5|nr:hypothetical protein [Modestobacter marinus]CCH88003.1 conserved membrane protein of unknown function [Modestobacter marinus]